MSGVVPPTTFNLSTIREIELVYNNFSGGLPSTLGLWVPNLKSLWLDFNSFSGPIPKSISNASQLTHLDLYDNHFSGFIPNALSALENLQVLSLARNNLTIESTTSKVSSILSSTTFKDLRVLILGHNPLNVTLPTSIGNLSASLEYLYLRNCNLRGGIPDEIAKLSSLVTLDLFQNGLSGTIPASFGKLQKLQGLYLGNNELQGTIPVELCQLQRLSDLDLSNNMLVGSIPMCLGDLASSLRWLSLASNNLTSAIPSTVWSLTDILHVDLSSNSLNGSLSVDVGNLKVVIVIDVSNNQLSGNISSSIGELQALVNLSLKNNIFEGSIPDSFGKLISVESLDLSNNNLSGEIPKSLQKLLYLKFLNLSFNKLYGEIPSGGHFANFSSQSFMANYGLCGASRLQVPPCKDASRKALVSVWRYVIPCVSVIAIVVVLVMVVLLRRRKVKHDSEIALFPYQEIWRKVTQLELSRATNGFKEDNLLGNGSFGSVYEGILSNGKHVAVKVFNLELEEAFKSFDTECELLCNIRHRNLVKIITCCTNVDFKALVLEYIPLGSLDKLLYSDDEFCMNILQRLNIMTDVASALEYLHFGYSTPIVHCDLKPSNVLLDEDMVAHVADFGIAKLLSGEDSMTQTMTLATIGYMAPEYGLDGIVSRKGDVYSYGIMLMEVFTKKKPTDEMFAGEMNLKQWVENSFPHSIPWIIDAKLLRTEGRHYAIKKDCLSNVMELALACSATSPEERIDMKNIVTTLNKIKKKFLINIGQI
ncbi:Mitogen-activated protein kinase kinase kinase [Parasponia andersonii]|uniref:non-specific serine/threonine protein kinase n=1 Tax=Parasponia andersonii TaxID=3476 RepID=A0A2P5AIF3_PARAD|nr:Mitogen-activated protein kinase kinase kinase [Parasponia andersonii]